MGFYIDDGNPTSPAPGSGFFIEDEPSAPSTPSLLNDPIGALTSADWWLTRPSGEKISPGQAVAGPATSVLDMLTFGQGDEIAARGASLLGGGSYDQTLATARSVQDSFHKAAPVVSTGLELASVLKNPMAMASKVGSTAGLLPKIGQAAKEGAIIGGAFGFGEGEGSLENRLASAKDSATIGAVTNGALTGLLQGGSNLASKYADRFSSASQETLERGLGLQYGDRAQGLNKVNLFVDDAGDIVPFDQLDDAVGIQAPIQKQVETLQESGILAGAPDDAQGLKIHITKEGAKVGKTIPQLVSEADKVIGSREIVPELKATTKFLDGYREKTKANLTKQMESIMDDYYAAQGSGLGKLTKFTDQLQKETNFDQATPKEVTQLKRMISYDMRIAAERQFDEALPEIKGAFAKANEIVAASKSIGKTLNKPLARKKPEFGDYIKGGSLPMTVATGALSAPLGVGPAAMVVGAKLAGNAVKKYAEAAKPISTAKLYDSIAGKLTGVAEKVAPKGGVNAIAASLTNGARQQPPSPQQSTEKSNRANPLSSQKATTDPISKAISKAEAELNAKPPEFIKNRPAKAELSDEQIEELGRSGTKEQQAAMEVSVRKYMKGGMSEAEAKKKTIADVRAGLRSKDPERKVKAVEALIDSDPVDSTIYEIESSRNPLAKNPNSTASGAFQLLKKTASSLGVKDVFDIEQNYTGYLKLKEEAKALAEKPEDFYAVHYLGAPTFKRWKAGKDLTVAQQEQVKFLTKKLLPKFRRIYAEKVKAKTGQVEA